MEQSERQPRGIIPYRACRVSWGAGGVIPGAVNSKRAGLAVSLGGVGSQTSTYIVVIVGLSVGTPPLLLMIAYNTLFCFMAPSFFLLGVFR